MKTYLRRTGVIAPFLLLTYLFIYMIVNWREEKSFPGAFKDQEVVRSKLDRIEETLNKVGEYQTRHKVLAL